LDFWNNSDAIPPERLPKMGWIKHRAIRSAANGSEEGTLAIAADWVNQAGKALLREETRFVFRGGPGRRSIDRITTLTAVDDTVKLDDAKDGMLGMRVTRALEQPSTTPEVYTDASGKATAVPAMDTVGVTGRYRSSEGLEGDAVWGTRGRWTTLSGIVQGQPITIAILDHPKNVGFPTYWHARGYGLFAANPLGQKALSGGKQQLNFRLPPGASTTFRYRILILDRPHAVDQIEREYRDFTKAPS
jgi:hypothetical protein